jgi:RNA polymerase sigma-70 factor (ECF subfamily)
MTAWQARLNPLCLPKNFLCKYPNVRYDWCVFTDEDILVNDGPKANTIEAAKLVNASQTGDRGAFDELVRLYQKRAMLVAVRILGSADEAAEAVQAGFLKAYLNIKKLRNAEQFECWLLRIVANAAISQARTAKRRVAQVRIADCSQDNAALSATQKQDAEELSQAVRQAMLMLSKKEAQAISLFGLQDMSQRQVTEIMNCSAEAVRWHVFNARKKLKVLLKEYLE